jgi:four helix bundle protein
VARDYKKIRAWQLADELAVMIYTATKEFPKAEMFGLTSQMRRAAVSVPANIVEGSARKHTNEYLQFLYTAMASLSEVGYFVDFSQRIGYLENGYFAKLTSLHEQTAKTLRALINYIENSNVHRPKSKVQGLMSIV